MVMLWRAMASIDIRPCHGRRGRECRSTGQHSLDRCLVYSAAGDFGQFHHCPQHVPATWSLADLLLVTCSKSTVLDTDIDLKSMTQTSVGVNHIQPRENRLLFPHALT
jgi:hypothetical protein